MTGAGEGNRTPDLRFTNSAKAADPEQNQHVDAADSAQVRKLPQHPRNNDRPIAKNSRPGPDKEGEE